jgi:hypothetical protein
MNIVFEGILSGIGVLSGQVESNQIFNFITSLETV